METPRVFGALIPDAEGEHDDIRRRLESVPTLGVARAGDGGNAGTLVYARPGAPFGRAAEHLRTWLSVLGLFRFQPCWRDAPCDRNADRPGA